ncbi:uncharacterized protein LOC106131615 [Amyelois transitella]|uniref:uncharacterized protein LOC106131615 n=1 Tax=Amyelois transitella TaxID=680683 RepID=UPI00298FA2F9|nr:uncharacterized protein LOC106131615 [Amyelois transitella]
MMWKYVSRRIRESFEKSVNHFEKRTTTGIVNQSGTGPGEEEKRSGPPCCWFAARKCWRKSKTDNKNTNRERYNFDCLNRNWLGAITWSGVAVVGWYTSQLAHLKLKYGSKKCEEQFKCFNNILAVLYPYVHHVKNNPAELTSSSTIEHIIQNLKPKVQLISNDHVGESGDDKPLSSNGSTSASSNDEFQDTLNYIENKLGWAAIQNGQLKDGIKLLRSAANRNHAPALYNLGLCYEMGIGLDINENKAMELYRSAARLEHPDALYNLSIYYAQGRGGLTKDKDTATRLLRLAAVQGHQVAKDTLDYLEVEVTEKETENEPELHSWSYQCSPYAQNGGLPTLTSLFVENVNYLQAHNYTEAIV